MKLAVCMLPGPADDNPDRGGFANCRTCPSKTPGPARTYHLEYNVTYRCAFLGSLRFI